MNVGAQESVVVLLIASHIVALAAGIAIGLAVASFRQHVKALDKLTGKENT